MKTNCSRINQSLKNDDCKIFWDFAIQTHKEIEHQRPDIIVIDKGKREHKIIDITVPGDQHTFWCYNFNTDISRIASTTFEKIRYLGSQGTRKLVFESEFTTSIVFFEKW